MSRKGKSSLPRVSHNQRTALIGLLTALVLGNLAIVLPIFVPQLPTWIGDGIGILVIVLGFVLFVLTLLFLPRKELTYGITEYQPVTSANMTPSMPKLPDYTNIHTIYLKIRNTGNTGVTFSDFFSQKIMINFKKCKRLYDLSVKENIDRIPIDPIQPNSTTITLSGFAFVPQQWITIRVIAEFENTVKTADDVEVEIIRQVSEVEVFRKDELQNKQKLHWRRLDLLTRIGQLIVFLVSVGVFVWYLYQPGQFALILLITLAASIIYVYLFVTMIMSFFTRRTPL